MNRISENVLHDKSKSINKFIAAIDHCLLLILGFFCCLLRLLFFIWSLTTGDTDNLIQGNQRIYSLQKITNSQLFQMILDEFFLFSQCRISNTELSISKCSFHDIIIFIEVLILNFFLSDFFCCQLLSLFFNHSNIIFGRNHFNILCCWLRIEVQYLILYW